MANTANFFFTTDELGNNVFNIKSGLLKIDDVTVLASAADLNSIDSSAAYATPSVVFGTGRKPSTTKKTGVIFNFSAVNTLGQTSQLEVQISPVNELSYTPLLKVQRNQEQLLQEESFYFVVPKDAYYKVLSTGTGTRAIVSVKEISL